MEKAAKVFIIQASRELGDLLLCDRGSEVDVPGGQAGERFGIAGEHAVEECGSAAQVAKDEERFV